MCRVKAFIFDTELKMLALYKEDQDVGRPVRSQSRDLQPPITHNSCVSGEVSRDRLSAPLLSNRQEALQWRNAGSPTTGVALIPGVGQSRPRRQLGTGRQRRGAQLRNRRRRTSTVRGFANPDFLPAGPVTWSNIGSGVHFRLIPAWFPFDRRRYVSCSRSTSATQYVDSWGYLNSTIVRAGLDVLALPQLSGRRRGSSSAVLGDDDNERVERLVELTQGPNGRRL